MHTCRAFVTVAVVFHSNANSANKAFPLQQTKTTSEESQSGVGTIPGMECLYLECARGPSLHPLGVGVDIPDDGNEPFDPGQMMNGKIVCRRRDGI
ncbi:hypothetical protein CDAR_438581 [Caerostris darwini]|uniref:Secreted protein n=1 Tax=Caerostris darwini TaxID=1538125 RepID=A0AAV4X424_9ARAC|nr:hypothetical protein CDAR_438581 [Caerostris darwini]